MKPGPMRIDARNLLCPLPVLRLRKALAGLAPGAEVTLAATDPMARIDVPHFCAEAGHDLLALTEAGEVMTFTIRRGPPTGS
jgi:tRNA 2-thiouridine synthesizing protein A